MASNTKFQNLFEFCVEGDRIGLADYIITNGCNPSAYDARDTNGRTALHIACQHGHLFTVRSLIEVFGCSPMIVDNSGNLPLHVACLHGQLSIVDYLFSLIDQKEIATAVFQTDSEGNNLLHKACQSGSVATVRYILQAVSYPKGLISKKLNLYLDSVTVYDASIEKSSLCQVISLLQCITGENTLGDTALHVACRHGHLKVLKVFQVYFPYNDFLESLFLIAVKCNHMIIVNYLRAVKNETVLDFNSEAPGISKSRKTPSRQKFIVTGARAAYRNTRAAYRNIEMFGDGDSYRELYGGGEDRASVIYDRELYRHGLVATCENCQQSFELVYIPEFDRSTSTGHCPFCDEVDDEEQLRFSFRCKSCSLVFSSDTIVKVNCLACTSSNLMLLLPVVSVSSQRLVTYDLHPHKHSKGPSQAAAMCGNLKLYQQAQMSFPSTENSLLHAACISDNVDLVKHIIETLNVGINELDSEDNTPLHVVCEWGSCNVFSFLLSSGDIQMTKINKDHQSPLSLACKYTRKDFVIKLLEYEIKNDGNALHLACGTGNIDIVKEVTKIRGDAFINLVDEHGDTPIFDACRSGNLELIKFLVNKGSNPLFINKQTKETSIHIACRMNRPDILEALCQSQLIHDQPSLESNILCISPIHLAIENNCFELVKIINQFCSLNLNQAINEKQATLAHCAVQLHNIELIIYLLKQPSVNWNAQDSDGNTALHLACIDDSYAIVKLISSENKQTNSTPSAVPVNSLLSTIFLLNKAKQTPLHLACKSKNTAILEHLLGKIPSACNLDKLVDADQNTVLHVAVKTGSIDKVMLLLEQTKSSVKCKNSW